MSRELIEDRGAQRRFESPIIQVVSSRDGKTLAALTADGEIVLVPRSELRNSDAWTVVPVHDGALCLAQDCSENAFLRDRKSTRLTPVT